jgi:hypothetical protein
VRRNSRNYHHTPKQAGISPTAAHVAPGSGYDAAA